MICLCVVEPNTPDAMIWRVAMGMGKAKRKASEQQQLTAGFEQQGTPFFRQQAGRDANREGG
jgi:hypothetical protein